MRTSEDALRSLKRYTAEILGDDWEVRIPDGEGTFARPFARVEFASGKNLAGGSQWLADVIQPFTMLAYPVAQSTAGESLLEAARVEELIFQGFRAGVGEGRPMRVPLYDYAGVPATDGSVARGYADFMRVNDLSVDSMRDPDDPALWTVVTDIRLSWRRTAAVVSGGKVVASVGYRHG